MKKIFAAATVLAFSTAAAAATAETLTVNFNDSNPTVSTGDYSGIVSVTVAGVGQSDGTALNDAFYVYTDGSGNPVSPQDGGYYDLGIGTGGSFPSVDNAVSPSPAYNPDHVYTFKFNTNSTTPVPIDFGVVDDDYADNTGSFKISISGASAVPEPATWAMMFAGLGMIGGVLRYARRRRPVALA